MMKRLAELDKLYEKTNNILNLVESTADEFFANVAFANAYSIIVPSSVENDYSLPNIVLIIAVVEIVIFLAFAMIIVVRAFVNQYNENNGVVTVKKAAKAEASKAEEEAEDEADEEKEQKKSNKNKK